MTSSRGVLAVLSIAALMAFAAPAQATPAGSNDFSCQPTAAHPRPVVLVHGLGGNEEEFFAFSPKLKAAGYCVFSLTYGVDSRAPIFGGVKKMEESSGELAAFIDKILAATGASKVDLVGHSEGTVMPRWYLERRGGAAKVQKFVAWTPLWRGTELLGIHAIRDLFAPSSAELVKSAETLCGSCPSFLKGSDYLNDLNADGEAIPGIEHTNIMTRYDELVIPYTSGAMGDGGTNIVVQEVCPLDFYEHAGLAVDPVTHQLTLNALDPANAKPVQC